MWRFRCQGDGRGPAVERVVVAVNEKGPHAPFGENFQAVTEGELRPHAPVGAVVDVAGDHQEEDVFVEAEPHK